MVLTQRDAACDDIVEGADISVGTGQIFDFPLTPLVCDAAVTIDGVSLTINGVTDDSVELCLIPHTAQITTLGRLSVSSRVNVEVDLIARYVERLLARS